MIGVGTAILGAGLMQTGWNIGSQLINWRREDSYNQAMWNRDDNAMQRRVEDLKAAGLSPVLAAGGSGAGNSQPVMSSLKQINNNPAMDYLAALQGKAQIDHTNAETGMINLQLDSEKFKQALLNNQVDYTKQMADNMSLQNAFYARDMESKLGLRGYEADKIKGEIALNLQNAALLKSRTALTDAETTYQQVRTDHERTLADQAKINRELLLGDLSYQPFMKQAQLLGNGGAIRSLIGGLYGFGAGLSDIVSNPRINQFDRKQFWDYNK